ncbi:NACHT, LRR and PYD domains-containing protein 12-like isoform X1 [Alosa alosa]|uniref:NACHT, LRR and PYD domains-containing protein 12-like isoform X1 n=1 Tax=Alosa alosa TaxID=278164 RepID=UPI0020152A1F|nr:NACHT, LRR and PYD domains-containing protein 12-like isoform X1 [Alosa alosa]
MLILGVSQTKSFLNPHCVCCLIPCIVRHRVAEPQTPTSSNIAVLGNMGTNVTATTTTGNVTFGNVYFGPPPAPPPNKEEFRKVLKSSLKESYENVHGANQGHMAFNDIYTDRDITIISGGSNQNKQIKCTDIFKHGERTVLTRGISGMGKTVSVQKFILDWVEGNSNQDVDFVFPIPFRNFNKKQKTMSLFSLLQEFFPDIKKYFLDPQNQYKTVIILDGLNEYDSSLDFKSEVFKNVETEASVDVLLVNLLKRNLLGSALLWITSQPAAVSQLPDIVYMLTELKGFNDQQKEEYFKKIHIGHDGKAEEVISYLHKSRSLSVLCDIPAFCQILSKVLQDTEKPFRSWTGLLGNFLYKHINQLKQKRDTNVEEKILLNLGKLAWDLLKKDEKDFDEKNLKACNIEADDYVVFSGICPESDIQSSQIIHSDHKRFRFFHPCIQEFLAAMYVILSFARDKKNLIQEPTSMKWIAKPTLFDVQKSAVKRVLKKKGLKTGHLDTFVIFLLSLCEKSNQDIVNKFMGWITKSQSQSTTLALKEDNEKMINYISKTLYEGTPHQSALRLRFLHELGDHSLLEKIKKYIRNDISEDLDQDLIVLLRTHKGIQQVFEMKDYMKSDADVTTLIPVAKMSNRAKLNRCNLTVASCDRLAQSLRNTRSYVTEMDLSENEIRDSGVEKISSMLQAGYCCNIECLSFVCCGLTYLSCESLSQALQTKDSHVRELDISNNDLGDQGLISLSLAMANVNCKLQTLRLACCQLTSKACKELSSRLQSADSSLKHLDLSFNDLQDSGVQRFAGITNLETLRLASCNLTEGSGQYIGELLQSQTLKELDLTNNNLKDSGVEQLLSRGLASADCTLEKLILKKCGITLKNESCSKVVSAAIKSEKCHLRELDLSYNDLLDSGAKAVIVAVVDASSKTERLSLACCALTEKTCELISSELKVENLATSCLREIDLSDNSLGSTGAIALSSVLKNTNCKWEKLCLSLCSITEDGCTGLANALRGNPSHMKHLDLTFNHPGELNNSNSALEGGEFRLRKGEDRYECTLTPDEDTAHQRLFLKKKKIRWGEWEIPVPQLSDRFDCRTQVLCKESLTGRCYWEVKWSGLVSIGVAYAGMARKGEGPDCTLGRNSRSWSLDCSDSNYTVWHDSKKTDMPLPPSGCHRVGVYLDWLDGTLAFFKIKTVSNQRMFFHLHTFKHNFSLPLYAGFRVCRDSSVFICPQTSQKKAA